MVIKVKRVQVFFTIFIVFCVAFAIAVQTDTLTVSNPLGEGDNIPLPIVMYHQISLTGKSDKYTLPLKQLEADFSYIKQKGYTAITVKELLAYVNEGVPLPAKPIMITFDDGHETFYSNVIPLLEKYNLKAILSIIGTVTNQYTEHEDHTLKYSYVNWEEVCDMVGNDFVEVQNHSFDMHQVKDGRKGMHRKKGESLEHYREAISADLNRLQDEFAERTGYVPTAVAYPFGEYSQETAGILRELGFQAAFTCEERVNHLDLTSPDTWLFKLRRFNRPAGPSSADFFEKLLT